VLILALETSGTSGSIAVLDDETTLARRDLPEGQRTAQSLAPTIGEALSSAGVAPGDIRLIAVTTGPGSFTGLRIGVTTAKTLAWAVGAEVIAVNTHDVIARQAPAEAASLHAIVDAHRNQLFAACYERDPRQQLHRTDPTQVIDISTWLDRLKSGDWVCGPGLRRVRSQVPSGVLLADEAASVPDAVQVGRVALDLYRAGHRDDLWELAPQYYRASAAEEKAPPRKQPLP
jgi:tRNA threonylcarbamoyladenosine biosynthesis protein TsaB